MQKEQQQIHAKGVQDSHELAENKGSSVREKVSGHMKEKHNCCVGV